MAYYVNGFGGVFFATCLIVAVIVSELNMLLVRRKISFGFSCEEKELNKGQEFSLKIRINKSTFLPSPYIAIKLKYNPKVDNFNKSTYKIAMSFGKYTEEVVANFMAKYSGELIIEIESIIITDYLGLFSHKINIDTSKADIKINVFPHIPLNNTPTELLKSASDTVGFDDSEDETDQTINFGSGIPGYEHRLYVPGDPLKKVNWKLSAKRDTLLLRKDERVSYSNHVILIDIFKNGDSEIDYEQIDILIENTLSLVSSLLMQQLSCKCIYFLNDEWNQIDIVDENSLLEFQRGLSSYSIVDPNLGRIPFEVIHQRKNSALLIFTNKLDNELLSILSASPDLHNNCLYISTEQLRPLSVNNAWLCDDLYEINRKS